MSASEVDQPRLSRTAPWASSRPNPMASRTCEGWTLPDEQAEPEDTAIPPRSKPITAVSAFSPGTVNRVVLGRRGASSENTIIPGVCFRPVLKAVPQALQPGRIALQGGHGSPHGRAERRDPRDILGAGPAAQLLTAATQQRLQPLHVLGQNQRADALGAADLVRRKRDQIGLHRLDIKRYFSKRLDRVDMQQPACFMHDVSDFADRLKRAGLVIGQHDRDQRRRPIGKQASADGRDRPGRSR